MDIEEDATKHWADYYARYPELSELPPNGDQSLVCRYDAKFWMWLGEEWGPVPGTFEHPFTVTIPAQS